MALTLTVGDDAVFVAPLTKNKAAFVINPGAVVRAAIVSLDLSSVLAGPVSCSDTDPGADWPNSTVAAVFPRSDTELITDLGLARLEIEVDDGGRLTWNTELYVNQGAIV